MTITTTQFLASVQRLIIAPSNQTLYDDADFFAIGDRKMNDTIVPLIDSLNGDWFVRTTEVQMVENQAEYRLPVRAMGRKLREVKIRNSANIRFDFPKISIEREQIYQVNGIPFGFYFKGDRFVVVPVPTTTQYSIQYWYFLGPSAMIPYTDAAIVTGVSGDDVTVSSVPSTLTVGTDVDFIQGSSGNQCLGIDVEITNIAGNTISFGADTVPTDLESGDFISVAGTSPVLQIPDQAVPLLTTLTAMDVLQGLSDFEGYDRLFKIAYGEGKNPGQFEMLKLLLQPRIEGEATKIINDFGLVNRGWRGRWWGYYNF
jgi:hypothetical protein